MNPDYLAEQLGLIGEYVSRARHVGQRPREEFLADPVLIDAAIRELTVLFETSHNIAKHLIASREWRAARSKAEAFEILAENGVVSDPLSGALRQASRFRNLVIYQTSLVDDGIVYKVLTEHLSDFEEFAANIASWLETNR